MDFTELLLLFVFHLMAHFEAHSFSFIIASWVFSFNFFSVSPIISMVPASHLELKQVQIFFSLLNCRLGVLSSWNGHRALPCLSTVISRPVGYFEDEMAVKIAEALDVSLDYLTGRSRNDLKDKKMLERFNEILGLMPEDRNGILYTIDGLIKAAKLKAL
jgi:hypothetical protein